jgi:hypothetical protein
MSGDAEFKKLDSTVKRNTALVKKLRQIAEDGLESLLKDILATNQSKVGTVPHSSKML